MYGDLNVKNWNFSLTHPNLMPSLVVILSEFPAEPYLAETRMMVLSDGEELVILA